MRNFGQRLVNLPKTERFSAVVEGLYACPDATVQQAMLESVANLGRKWRRWLLAELQLQIGNEHPLYNVANHYLRSERTLELVIRDRETGCRLSELTQLADRLESLPHTPQPILRVIFDTPHAYVYGLCSIVAWAFAHAESLEVSSNPPRVEHFLRRTGILDSFQSSMPDPVRYDSETIFGITRIDLGGGLATDTHAARLVELFQQNIELDPPTAQILSISFAELIENAIKHGQLTSPGWLFANYHPQPKIMHICICDRGIGVQKTFEQSSSLRLQRMATDQNAWLREATRPLVTSKSENHAGYGLYVASELCRRNGGIFAMISGSAGFAVSPSRPGRVPSDQEELVSLNVPWRGTLVALQIHLDQPLKLHSIWETLPAPWDDAPSHDVNLFNA